MHKYRVIYSVVTTPRPTGERSLILDVGGLEHASTDNICRYFSTSGWGWGISRVKSERLIEGRARGEKGTVVVERSDRRSKHDEHDDVGLSCVLRICGWRKNPCRVLICHQTAYYYRSAGSRWLFSCVIIRIIMEAIWQ
jgi:hypothetical protein